MDKNIVNEFAETKDLLKNIFDKTRQKVETTSLLDKSVRNLLMVFIGETAL